MREEVVSWKIKKVYENFVYVCVLSIIQQGEFVDDGTDTHFEQDGIHFILMARASGNKRDGLVHSLMANGNLLPETSGIN